MTREEAKEILTHNWTRVDNPNYSESELDEAFFMAIKALSDDFVKVVRCKDCIHGEHIQIPLWENRDIDKAPSQFHDFIKCHKFHIKGFNETLYLGDDDYCSYGERGEV